MVFLPRGELLVYCYSGGMQFIDPALNSKGFTYINTEHGYDCQSPHKPRGQNPGSW